MFKLTYIQNKRVYFFIWVSKDRFSPGKQQIDCNDFVSCSESWLFKNAKKNAIIADIFRHLTIFFPLLKAWFLHKDLKGKFLICGGLLYLKIKISSHTSDLWWTGNPKKSEYYWHNFIFKLEFLRNWKLDLLEMISMISFLLVWWLLVFPAKV